MTRLPAWTIVGLLAVMLVAVGHTLVDLLLERRHVFQLFPRDWGQW